LLVKQQEIFRSDCYNKISFLCFLNVVNILGSFACLHFGLDRGINEKEIKPSLLSKHASYINPCTKTNSNSFVLKNGSG